MLKSHLPHLALDLESLSVYLACEQVLISGALGTFSAYAMAEIAPLRRSLVNIQKRKCRSIASI